MKLRLDIHQYTAVLWLAFAWFFLVPAGRMARNPHAAHVIGYVVLIMTLAIAACPLALRWGHFRTLFRWTDAISEAQRQTLAQRNLLAFYRQGAEDGYVSRLLPYLWRILAVNGVLVIGASFLPAGSPFIALSWYPFMVMTYASSTVPWVYLVRRVLWR
ncbi:hypothetical protein KDW40_01720 [Burkholderia cenocepacia]|uniref:hypothetical protein n=1 Tax=Burkholderia cenocepacia TaxID=95486 RepID=UPI001B9537BA|nr:hypothetical protein [Burkholderia cenocepacia]MBR8043183.1 hypothetical protein [Burkholderia cenocepacia]MBR8324447.1 hypothetical protein [Burkholderia cenocepacia]